jgi:hypothetical protein
MPEKSISSCSPKAPRQSHHGGADRYTEAQAGPKLIVATMVRQDTASSAGAGDQAYLREYNTNIARSLRAGMASPIRRGQLG